MRKFAHFLPQFHEIEENNRWWGEGFTEWRNVRNAQPLFPGHKQPVIPLNQNYYNLLDRKTVEWQTSLLKEYHVDGLIYYHYYFQGKLLLEKPAENLLKWKDINQPFFFCWANHSWIRSWNSSQEILMEQTYGDEADWENHFQYLLPFFQDSRYEKKDGRPVFMLFSSAFREKDSMMTYLDRRCRESGFAGLFLIEMITSLQEIDTTNKVSYAREYSFREPAAAMQMYIATHPGAFARWKLQRLLIKMKRKAFLVRFDGNALWKMHETDRFDFTRAYPGLCFAWDNTPRHKTNGYIISPISRDTFDRYMDSVKACEYLFIDAWNEWAEGMMLEPTVENGDAWLRWIKEWTEKNEG